MFQHDLTLQCLASLPQSQHNPKRHARTHSNASNSHRLMHHASHKKTQRLKTNPTSDRQANTSTIMCQLCKSSALFTRRANLTTPAHQNYSHCFHNGGLPNWSCTETHHKSCVSEWHLIVFIQKLTTQKANECCRAQICTF